MNLSKKQVVIIGLDGLEATLIDPKRFPNICQEEHGRINLDGFEQIQTPQIWTSFITGVMPCKHGINGFKNQTILSRIEKKYGECIKKLLSYFGLKTVNWATNAKNSLYGYYNLHPYESYTKEDIKVPTIFDKIPNSHVISLPVYNEPPIYMDIRKSVVKAVNNPKLSEQLSHKCMDLAKSEMNEFIKHLNDEIDILMVHLFVSDVYGHIFGDDKLLELYDLFEELIGMIKTDSFTIIISDHGTKQGFHTPYGFYSISKPLGLDNPYMTEFHDIILKELK